MKIKFRPHHFLCTVGFQGKGYSPEFVQNFSDIVSILNGPQGDTTEIEVTDITDSICAPCPLKREHLCVTQEKIQSLDNNHSATLNIKPGQNITWGDAKKRIVEKMTLSEFNHACAQCGWKSLGICEQALIALQNNIKK